LKKCFMIIAVLILVCSMLMFGCGGPADTPATDSPDTSSGVSFSFLSNHEFSAREDGLPGVQALYGFEFTDVEITSTGITYAALADGLVDSAMGFATDGRIAAWELVNLVDDLNFFPVYNPAPVVRQEIVDQYPEVAEVLGPIAKALDTETMTLMNMAVDVDGTQEEEVALTFLTDNGFVSGMPAQGSKGPITIGSKQFTEQLILGQIAVLALRDAGFNVVDMTGLGGTLVCRESLESGEIDMYWEYTGTAWIAIFTQDEPITDSDECYNAVKELDAENGLVWLDYALFDNTYTIMMRKAHADELGIVTISDLADYINENK